MEELAKARAAIVIWTENSVTSDWVMSEAGRAHADQKLIPVKVRGLEYRDIPPPFDNQHTENLDAHENILAAVQGQLSKPPPPAPLWKKARLELLGWIGVVGTSISLAANLRGLVQLASWVRQLVDDWIFLLHSAWAPILAMMDLAIGRTDAVLLSIILFLITMLTSTLTFKEPIYRTKHILLGFLALGIIFSSAAISALEMHDAKLLRDTIDLVVSRLAYFFAAVGFLWGVSILAVFLIVNTMLLITVAKGAQKSFGSVKWYPLTNFALLARRCWRIIIGVALILALNYASLFSSNSHGPRNCWQGRLLANALNSNPRKGNKCLAYLRP